MKRFLILIFLTLLQGDFALRALAQSLNVAKPALADADAKSSATATASANGNSGGAANAVHSVTLTDNANGSTGGAQNKIYRGKVEIVELELEALEELGPYIKSIMKAAKNLADTVTFQPVTIITQPTMVGPNSGTITNIPVGVQPTGPPKQMTKRELDAAINRMKPTIDRLKSNVDEFMTGERQLHMPADLLAQLNPQFTEWIGLVNRISAQEIELMRISNNPPYDNLQIAKAALIIEQSAKRLEKVRSSVNKTMRKERKRIAAQEKSLDNSRVVKDY